MRRFARALYRSLVEEVHTGSLHDWFRFLSSWLALLIVMAVLAFIVYVFVR